MDIKRVIADNLTAWMNASPDLNTLQKVAAQSGVSFSTVQRMKAGISQSLHENVEQVAKAFGKTADDMRRPDGTTMPVTQPPARPIADTPPPGMLHLGPTAVTLDMSPKALLIWEQLSGMDPQDAADLEATIAFKYAQYQMKKRGLSVEVPRTDSPPIKKDEKVA